TVEGRAVAVSGGDDGTVRVWDLASGRPAGEPLTGHTDWVRAVAVGTVEGRAVAVSGGEDGTVRVWDLARATCLMTLPTFDEVRSVGVISGGLLIGAGAHVCCVDFADLSPLDSPPTPPSPRRSSRRLLRRQRRPR
ncbi:MAG: hypothetical protein ACRD12_05515, partial [Acidimicrobiales bacterium]